MQVAIGQLITSALPECLAMSVSWRDYGWHVADRVKRHWWRQIARWCSRDSALPDI